MTFAFPSLPEKTRAIAPAPHGLVAALMFAVMAALSQPSQAQVRHGVPGRPSIGAPSAQFSPRAPAFNARPGYYRSGPAYYGHYHGGGWGPGWFIGGLGLGIGLAAASTYYYPPTPVYAPGYYYGPSYYAAPVVSATVVPAAPGQVIPGAPVDERLSSQQPLDQQPLQQQPPQPQLHQPPAGAPPIFYPRNGQSSGQIEQDRQECNRWATTQDSAVSDASVFQRAVLACMDGRGYTVR